jgi:hypothetical protein
MLRPEGSSVLSVRVDVLQAQDGHVVRVREFADAAVDRTARLLTAPIPAQDAEAWALWYRYCAWTKDADGNLQCEGPPPIHLRVGKNGDEVWAWRVPGERLLIGAWPEGFNVKKWEKSRSILDWRTFQQEQRVEKWRQLHDEALQFLTQSDVDEPEIVLAELEKWKGWPQA